MGTRSVAGRRGLPEKFEDLDGGGGHGPTAGGFVKGKRETIHEKAVVRGYMRLLWGHRTLLKGHRTRPVTTGLKHRECFKMRNHRTIATGR